MTFKVGDHMRPCSTQLGMIFRTHRLEIGFSLKRLALDLNVSREWLSAIERGDAGGSRSLAFLLRYAARIEMDPSAILMLDLKPKRKPTKLKNRVPGTLGKFLTLRRQELDLSQKETAKRAGISTGLISGAECGTYPHRIRPEILARLAKALKCEIPAELML